MDIMDALVKELEDLPKDRLLAVLTYVRLLKIRTQPLVSRDVYEVERNGKYQYAEVDRRTR